MPTYSYLCSECQHRFDTVQRMSEDPLTECPACHRPALVRQISAVNFALKGTGWYVTDFRDKGQKTKGDGDAGASAADDKASSTTSPPDAGGESAAKTAASSD